MRSARCMASFAVPPTAALGNYALRVQSGDLQTSSGFEVQEYRKPEFEVIVTPAARFERQGREAVVSIQARYYFGQPVANGQLRWVVNQQPYYSPLRWDDGFEGGESSYWYGDNQTAQGTVRLDAEGKAQIRVPLGGGRERPRLQRAHRGAGHRRRQPRGVGQHDRARHLRVVPDLRADRQLGVPRRQHRRRQHSRRSTTPAPRKPNIPVTRRPRAAHLSSGLLQRARSRPDQRERRHDRRQRPGHGPRHAAQPDRQLPRPRHARRAATARCRTTCGCGCRGRARPSDDSGERYLELLSDRKTYQPASRRA